MKNSVEYRGAPQPAAAKQGDCLPALHSYFMAGWKPDPVRRMAWISSLFQQSKFSQTKHEANGAVLLCIAAHSSGFSRKIPRDIVFFRRLMCPPITERTEVNPFSYAVKVLGGCDLGAVTRCRRISESGSDALKLQGFGLAFFLRRRTRKVGTTPTTLVQRISGMIWGMSSIVNPSPRVTR